METKKKSKSMIASSELVCGKLKELKNLIHEQDGYWMSFDTIIKGLVEEELDRRGMIKYNNEKNKENE